MSSEPGHCEYPHQGLLLPAQVGSGPLGPQLHWPLYGDSEETYCGVVVFSRECLQQRSQFKLSNSQTNLYLPKMGDSLSGVFLLGYLSYCSNAECYFFNDDDQLNTFRYDVICTFIVINFKAKCQSSFVFLYHILLFLKLDLFVTV